MNRKQLVERTQAHLRDFQLTAFREIDVIRFINEGIERVTQLIPKFGYIEPLEYDTAIPTHIPPAYHHLLAVYSASRLFAQDDRFYQASTLMNEFELKISGMLDELLGGDLEAFDKEGNLIEFWDGVGETVTDRYFADKHFHYPFKRGGFLGK